MASRFPPAHYKIYRPSREEVFVSPNFARQSTTTDDEGIRISLALQDFSKRFSHVKSLHDLFEVGLYSSRFLPCLASRASIDQEYKWMNYKEVDAQIRAFGSALIKTLDSPNEDDHRFVGIYSRNTPEWVITQYACAAYSCTYVPLYDTLGKGALQHILNQTELKLLVCYSAKEAGNVLHDLATPFLTHIVIMTRSNEAEQLRKEFTEKIRLFYFDEFLEFGKTVLQPKKPSSPGDLCTLCYTSGTTGTPKGVIIRHFQLVDAVLAIGNSANGMYSSAATVHLSYLPLAHILEQLIMNYVILSGARAAFITGGPETLLNDLKKVRPTIFGAVPRVLCKLRTNFYKRIPNIAWIRSIVERSIHQKLQLQANGVYKNFSLIDYFLFKKFRKALGGQICIVVSGGASLVPEVDQFCRAVLNCPVIQGYGATETTGLLSLSLVGDPECGIVGPPATGVEVKLVDVPDMEISVARDHVGEICVRGRRITEGYYKDSENTASLFDSDGWLLMGDIGKWTETGALKVVDRRKNLFKLAQGEYIAPDKIEGIYQCCPLVLYVLVEGDSTRTYPVAVVHPDFTEMRSLLVHDGVSLNKGKLSTVTDQRVTDEELCADIAVRKLILTKMNAVGRQRGLKSLEMAKSIHLTTTPFTIDNGLLTPTLKIVRFRARVEFREPIRRMYEEGELNV